SLSYRVSLSVEVKDVSDTGKATGGTSRCWPSWGPLEPEKRAC
ncbi:unnamed protein product, partial [Ectocarpus sp. 12 AP-2014]